MPSVANKNQNDRRNSTTFVYVGCKLPHGLILQLFDREPPPAHLSNGLPNPESINWRPTGPRIELKGANSIRDDYSLRNVMRVQYPFAVTPVPKDFWDKWYERNKDLAFIRNGQVFALDREREVIAEGKVRESETTGLEALRPDIENDPRMPNKRQLPPEQRVEADHERLAHLLRQNNL